MTRRAWPVLASALAACAAPPAAPGEIVVVAAEGARVEVLEGATGDVAASAVVPAGGRVRLPAELGDRVLIGRDSVGQVTILDGVRPGREYTVYAIPTLEVASIVVALPPVAGAVGYVVASRCGGTVRGGAVVAISVCPEGDELVAGALDAADGLIAAGWQGYVPAFGGSVTFSAPLTAPTSAPIALTPPAADAATDLDVALVTPAGTVFEAPRVTAAALALAPVALPALAGDVRARAVTPTDREGRREIVVRAAAGAALALDFAAAPLPAVTSATTYDAAARTLAWTTASAAAGARPDTVRVRFFGEDRNAYTLVAPYTGDVLALPALPADRSPLAPAGAIELTLAATPEGYNVTLNTLTRREDPAYRRFALALITDPGT